MYYTFLRMLQAKEAAMTFACKPISSPTPPLAAINNRLFVTAKFFDMNAESMQLYFHL